jgi:tetratricopeptide (TPR) repeat protein
MKELTLQLRHTLVPVREPVAYFIAGADVIDWLDEICRWKITQDRLRLFVLPRTPGDRVPCGVLVVVPEGTRPVCVPRALGFGVIAGKLYVPIDSEFSPPIEPHELKLLHHVQVFHPGIGIVGFEPSDSLTVAALLRQPPSRVENWNLAKPGVHLNQRLQSVQLLVPISMQDIFGDAPKEIGSEPIKEIPPAPGEPWKSPAGHYWTEARRRLAQALYSFLRRLPHKGTRRTWVNDLEDWASARIRRLVQDLETMRNKEIHRLLHQLEDDPDTGLRHAIPISQLQHRGIAPPAATLGQRSADFNLEHLRRGKAADMWHLSAEIQLQLRNKYRELANRELQLERFRRAAFIFAELLGDLEAAASALKQGRHFREAAAVYKEHLRRPREAANCLVEGGLLSEAISIYEQESLFLEAGELYRRLGQSDQANAAYQLEVERRLRSGDRLGGAHILEEKLDTPEQALTVLNEGWPHSQQAGKCLSAEFELLARKAWHSRASERLGKLRSEDTKPGLIETLARVLTAQSSQYPDRGIRRFASDLVRVKASQRMETAATALEVSALSDCLIKLAPDDKLLARDVARFSALRKERFRTNQRVTAVRKAPGPVLVRTFELPKGISWHTVKSCGGYFFAAGNGLLTQPGRSGLFLVRGDWEGGHQIVRWPAPVLSPPPFLLEIDEEISRPAQIIVTPGPSRPLMRLAEKAFPAADRFPGVVPAGTPDWLPDDLVSLCTRSNMAWLLRDTEDGLSECRSLDGSLVSSLGLAEAFVDNPGGILLSSILVQRDYIWLAAKQRLLLFRQGKTVTTWQAETDIASLVPSAPNLPLCVATRLENGVSLHWTDALKERTETICNELRNPLATFTSDGTLVLIANNEGRICEGTQRGISGISSFTLLRGNPIAVVRAEGSSQFAVFTEEGKVHVFRLAR